MIRGMSLDLFAGTPVSDTLFGGAIEEARKALIWASWCGTR
jgi:hypothetical protein